MPQTGVLISRIPTTPISYSTTPITYLVHHPTAISQLVTTHYRLSSYPTLRFPTSFLPTCPPSIFSFCHHPSPYPPASTPPTLTRLLSRPAQESPPRINQTMVQCDHAGGTLAALLWDMPWNIATAQKHAPRCRDRTVRIAKVRIAAHCGGSMPSLRRLRSTAAARKAPCCAAIAAPTAICINRLLARSTRISLTRYVCPVAASL